MRHDATTAECLVFTSREGLLAAVGHDLCLRVQRFSVEIGADDAIMAEFDPASLAVTGEVSTSDRRQIEQHTADDVLETARYPRILFQSRSVRRNDTTAEIEGELTLHGAASVIKLIATRDETGWHSEIRLQQTDFGIRPYSAMFGALRVRNEVLVRVRLPNPQDR